MNPTPSRVPPGPLKCFVTFRLRPGVTMEEYVEWFQTENLAAAAAVTAIADYRVWVRRSVHEGDVAWSILEEMDVLDLELCRRQFDELPEMQEMQKRWRAMTSDASVVFVEHVHGEKPAAPPETTKCFATFRLRPETSFDEYLTWFRERNLPAVAQQTATRGLRVWRRIGVHEGPAEWDVIEELDVLDAERAGREFAELPAMQAVVAEWHAMASDAAVVFADEMPQTAA